MSLSLGIKSQKVPSYEALVEVNHGMLPTDKPHMIYQKGNQFHNSIEFSKRPKFKANIRQPDFKKITNGYNVQITFLSETFSFYCHNHIWKLLQIIYTQNIITRFDVSGYDPNNPNQIYNIQIDYHPKESKSNKGTDHYRTNIRALPVRKENSKWLVKRIVTWQETKSQLGSTFEGKTETSKWSEYEQVI